MTIAIIAIGTRGDVQPAVGLARKINENHSQHTACVITHASYRDAVESAGVSFSPLGSSPAPMDARASPEGTPRKRSTQGAHAPSERSASRSVARVSSARAIAIDRRETSFARDPRETLWRRGRRSGAKRVAAEVSVGPMKRDAPSPETAAPTGALAEPLVDF